MTNLNFSDLKDIQSIKKLSVVISADSFLYGLIDENGKIIKSELFSSINFGDSQDIAQSLKADLIRLKVNAVSVCSKQHPFLHLHQKDDGIYNFFPAFEMRKVFRDKFTGEDVYNYFGLSVVQLSFLDHICKGYTLHHFSTILANYYYPSGSEGIHVDFGKNYLHIFFSDVTGFKFYNSFSFQSNEDVLYFILAIYKYLDKDPMHVKLNLSGLIDKSSALFRLLYGYIAHVEFKDSFPCVPAFSTGIAPSHYYFDVGVTSLCE